MRLAILGVAAALATSCGSSSQTATSPSGARCGVQIQSESASFTPSGGSGAIRVTTARECAWTAQSGAAWLSLASPASGQGEGTVQFSVSPHGDPAARNGSIAINDAQLQISQEGRPCQIDLSSVEEVFDAAGGRRTIQVSATSAQCAWTASGDVPWIDIVAGQQGTGSGSVTFDVAAAASIQRSGTLTIAGRAVRIEQTPQAGPAPGPGPVPGPVPGCSYSLDPPALHVGADGGASRLGVSAPAGCAWTAEITAPWITVTTGQTGSGPGEIRLSVAPSNSGPRSATIRAGTAVATITQGAPCTIAVSPAAVAAPAAGAAGTIQISAAASCPWTTTVSGASWISITGAAGGAGTGQVGYAIAPNTGPARQGAITVGGQAVSVSQAGGCTYAVSPAALEIGAAGESGSVSLTTAAACVWTAQSHASWLTPAQASGTGPGDVRFSAAANGGEPRRGTMTVAGQIVTVSQGSPCTWRFAPTSTEMPALGGAAAVLVLVTGDCSWTAVSSASWITVVSGSGTGNGLMLATIAPNDGPARTGTVVIGGSPYTIAQQGR